MANRDVTTSIKCKWENSAWLLTASITITQHYSLLPCVHIFPNPFYSNWFVNCIVVEFAEQSLMRDNIKCFPEFKINHVYAIIIVNSFCPRILTMFRVQQGTSKSKIETDRSQLIKRRRSNVERILTFETTGRISLCTTMCVSES